MLELRACVLGGVVALCASIALGQWSVTNLHPAGATESRAHGVSGGQQVGRATIGLLPHASLWKGSAETWNDLHPASASQSECWDIDHEQIVGYAKFGSIQHAAFWPDGAGSWIDLHPAGATDSVAFGIDGGVQAGSYTPSGPNTRAAQWTGSAASLKNLHPPIVGGVNYAQSAFNGKRDGQAVGLFVGGGGGFSYRGAVFENGAWVNETPSWPASPPYVYCNISMASRGQQVGYVAKSGFAGRIAVLWAGSAESALSLAPIDSSESWAQGVWRGQQVGYVTFTKQHAVLWNGAAHARFDLHSVLPSDFDTSNARGIWSDRSRTYVVGWGANSATGRTEALMWSRKSCWPDLTHDEFVDDADFVPFAAAYDEMICPEKLCLSDFNDDGVVDDEDFQIFVAGYDAMVCP